MPNPPCQELSKSCFSLLYVYGLSGVVGLTLPMARADRGSRPVYYLPCSDLGQVVNLSLSVAVEKHVLDKDRLKLLYSTLLEPYITYCCSVWSSPYKNGNLDWLFKLQKAAVRVISHSSYLAHSDPLFSFLKIIKIYDLTHLAVLTFMYRAVNNLLSEKFSGFLKIVHQVHSHDTRNSTNYVFPMLEQGLKQPSSKSWALGYGTHSLMSKKK